MEAGRSSTTSRSSRVGIELSFDQTSLHSVKRKLNVLAIRICSTGEGLGLKADDMVDSVFQFRYGGIRRIEEEFLSGSQIALFIWVPEHNRQRKPSVRGSQRSWIRVSGC